MKTLRDERSGLGWIGVERKYGSYRVVEGVLYRDFGFAYVHTDEGDVNVGRRGDHVKLLLPPEEKEKTPRVELLARLCRAENDIADMGFHLHDERARADKYEKALREIVEHGTPDYQDHGDFENGLEMGRREAGEFAKEALDDTES